jgi:hypothetical protein
MKRLHRPKLMYMPASRAGERPLLAHLRPNPEDSLPR